MLDVDRWLDTIEPWQFDEWVAFRRLEPDPLDRLAGILKLGFAAVVNSWGGDVKPDYFDPGMEEATAQEVTPDQAAAMMRLAYGR